MINLIRYLFIYNTSCFFGRPKNEFMISHILTNIRDGTFSFVPKDEQNKIFNLSQWLSALENKCNSRHTKQLKNHFLKCPLLYTFSYLISLSFNLKAQPLILRPQNCVHITWVPKTMGAQENCWLCQKLTKTCAKKTVFLPASYTVCARRE